MTRLQEIARRLTPAQLAEVEDFAEFLAARSAPTALGPPRTAAGGINVDAVVGLCEGMGGDKNSVELVHEALDALADKYMKD